MFYKRLLSGVAGVLLLVMGQLATAEISTRGNSLANFESGYFMDLQLGFHSRIDVGYNFNPYFALEAGFGYTRPIIAMIAIGADMRVYTFDVLAKATLPLEKIFSCLAGWNLYAKIGPTFLTGTVDRVLWVFETSGRVSGVIPYGALGIGYNFNEHFGLDLSCSIFGPVIGLSYRF